MTTKRSVYIFVLAILCWPNFAWADNIIYISQVQITNGTGHTADDFIELFNPHSEPFNLKGYRLVKRTATGASDTSIKSWTSDEFIPAYSFYLWANSNFSSISASPNLTTTGSIADNNGIAIRLGVNDAGTIIDSVAWGTANNSFNNVSSTNPEAGQALVRQDLFSASSAFTMSPSSPRNSSTSQAPASSPSPSPSPSPDPVTETSTTTPETTSSPVPVTQQPIAKTRAIKISEVLPNPEGEDDGGEIVELENTGSEVVSLDGWLLDDKSDTGPKSRAYKLMGYIGLKQFLSISLPKGSFALNNSSADSVVLYYPDKTIADSVNYTGPVQENISYQKIGSTWVWGPPTLGSINAQPAAGKQGAQEAYKIVISEFLPNPEGQDEGGEWVELYNPNLMTVSLKGFILDDAGTDLPGSGSVVLGESDIIPAGGFLKVNIPEGKFTLQNNKDSVRLFNLDKNLLEEISYTEAPEGKSYFKDEKAVWMFGLPTPGAANSAVADELNLFISEILANPSDEEDEFVEIYNAGEKAANIEKLVLQIGEKKKSLEGFEDIESKGFLTIFEEDLPARLRNSGQTVKLLDQFGREISSATYPLAKAGQSFSSEDGKSYSWTSSATPSSANQYILGEETKNVENKSATAKTSSVDITRAQANNILKSSEGLQAQLAVLQGSVDGLQAKLDENQQTMSAPIAAEIKDTSKYPIGRIVVWPTALAALGGAVYMVFRKVQG